MSPPPRTKHEIKQRRTSSAAVINDSKKNKNKNKNDNMVKPYTGFQSRDHVKKKKKKKKRPTVVASLMFIN